MYKSESPHCPQAFALGVARWNRIAGFVAGVLCAYAAPQVSMPEWIKSTDDRHGSSGTILRPAADARDAPASVMPSNQPGVMPSTEASGGNQLNPPPANTPLPAQSNTPLERGPGSPAKFTPAPSDGKATIQIDRPGPPPK